MKPTDDTCNRALAQVHGYIVLGPSDDEQTEQRIRQAIEAYVRDYLPGAAIIWHVDHLARPAREVRFLSRPVGTRLFAASGPGQHIVFETPNQITSRTAELRRLLGCLLTRGVHVHFSVAPPREGFTAEQMVPMFCKYLELVSRFNVANRRPRRPRATKKRQPRRFGLE